MKQEQQIEEAILYWLNYQYQCMAFKLNLKGTWDPKRGFFCKAPKWVPRGGSDIIFCLSGKFGAFEVKTPSEYKRFWSNPAMHEREQQAFLLKVRDKGGFSQVVCSLKQVEDHIAQLRRQILDSPEQPRSVNH